MEHSLFVGIDVAKERLDVHLRPTGETFSIGHDEAGLVALTERLVPCAPAIVVLEATGGYEVTVAAALASARLPIAVVNPRQIRDFARATGQLAKTDALDARVIARFAEAVRPVARPLPDAQAQVLGEFVARRRQLVEMLGAETNRRRLVRDPQLQRRIAALSFAKISSDRARHARGLSIASRRWHGQPLGAATPRPTSEGKGPKVGGEQPDPRVPSVVHGLGCVRPPVGCSDGGGHRLRESG